MKKYEDEARFPFYADGFDNGGYQFCRTCPETFKKKMAKKTVEHFANIYPDVSPCFHSTKELADRCATDDRIACVKLTGEYEVEE